MIAQTSMHILFTLAQSQGILSITLQERHGVLHEAWDPGTPKYGFEWLKSAKSTRGVAVQGLLSCKKNDPCQRWQTAASHDAGYLQTHHHHPHSRCHHHHQLLCQVQNRWSWPHVPHCLHRTVCRMSSSWITRVWGSWMCLTSPYSAQSLAK